MINSFIKFLKQGIEEFNLTTLSIEFHGGEPLMQNKSELKCALKKMKFLSINHYHKINYFLEWKNFVKREDITFFIDFGSSFKSSKESCPSSTSGMLCFFLIRALGLT